MAQPKTVKPITNRGPVNTDIVRLFKLQTKLVQRQITLIRQTATDPFLQPLQLAAPLLVALKLRRKATRLATQLDHIVYEFRRNTEMTRRIPVTITLVYKCYNTFA